MLSGWHCWLILYFTMPQYKFYHDSNITWHDKMLSLHAGDCFYCKTSLEVIVLIKLHTAWCEILALQSLFNEVCFLRQGLVLKHHIWRWMLKLSLIWRVWKTFPPFMLAWYLASEGHRPWQPPTRQPAIRLAKLKHSQRPSSCLAPKLAGLDQPAKLQLWYYLSPVLLPY